MTEQGAQARLLMVCRANVCRSPLSEFVATQRFAGSGVAVSSAGTDAAVGQTLCHRVEKAIAGRPGGADFAAQHRVTPLGAARLATADLVLTASPRERSRIAMAHPWLRDRTFTLIEVERLLSSMPVAGQPTATLAELADLLNQQRWLAADENWPGHRRLWEVLDRRRPAIGLSIRDPHAAERRPSHARVLQYTETLVGHVSDEILVRLGARPRDEADAAQAESGPGESRHAI